MSQLSSLKFTFHTTTLACLVVPHLNSHLLSFGDKDLSDSAVIFTQCWFWFHAATTAVTEDGGWNLPTSPEGLGDPGAVRAHLRPSRVCRVGRERLRLPAAADRLRTTLIQYLSDR